MLKSVRAIKEKTLIANRIVKSDNQLLSDLNSLAEKNQDNLKTVNDSLTERVSRSCNCWIWLMILLVLIIFVMMVLFMKIFSKRKYAEVPQSTTYKHFLNNNTYQIGNESFHSYELWVQLIFFSLVSLCFFSLKAKRNVLSSFIFRVFHHKKAKL